MILIYSHNITNRLSYTLDLIIKTVLNEDYILTSNKLEYINYSGIKLSYSNEAIDDSIFIYSNTILFETGLRPLIPKANTNYTNFPKFFESDLKDFLGYDLFAMVFYFASRYEEYFYSDLDKHQRFKAKNSLTFKYNCLDIPFLNRAILDFSHKLKGVYPQLNIAKREYNFVSTIDIDNAYAFAYKGFKRNTAGFTKDVLSFNFKNCLRRIKSILNSKHDPYNTYDLIEELTLKTKLIYFILIADYSQYDKNPHFKNKGFRNLIISLSQKHITGLHPSYYCNTQFNKIETEQKRLQEIINKKNTLARCHFLRTNLPETYRHFIENGITDDYSMIYASQCGFRTGLCMPYFWFDIEKNETTQLTIHTSVIMEGILRDYNKLNFNDALQKSLKLLQEVKAHGGEFISIFHNDSFTAENKEWIELYKNLIINSNS